MANKKAEKSIMALVEKMRKLGIDKISIQRDENGVYDGVIITKIELLNNLKRNGE